MATLFGKSRPSRLSSPVRAQRRRLALTASGERIRRRDMANQRRLLQAWQKTSYDFYDKLGEIKYASQFYSRMLSPLELYAAELNDEGEWVRTDDAEAKAALERIQDPGGGRQALQWDYGRQMFLIGETELFVSKDDYGDEQWEFLSPDELRVTDGIMYRYRAPQLGAEEYRPPDTDDEADADYWEAVGPADPHSNDPKRAIAYRIWQRHPRYSALADSTMRGVLDICEELDLLTKAVRARTRSRLAGNGLLLIDERISPKPPKAEADEDEAADQWFDDLVEAMLAPLEDEGSAAAMVPLLARVTAPDGGTVQDLIHHLQLVDPTQLYPETGLRYECIKRLAVGLDMPPTELTGMEDSNHWTAWIVDENTWKAHGQQKADQLVNDLTSAYFRPYLREAVKMGERARKFAIRYDATGIINHPDRSKDGKDLHDRFVIGDEALRESCGFDDDDAPTEEERNRMIGVAIRDGSLAVYGIPSVKGGTIEPEAGDVEDPQSDSAGPTRNAEVEPGPPKSANGKPTQDVVASTVARILGAADLAQLRARQAAGNKLLSLANKNSELRAELRGVKTGDVAAVLGKERVRALKGPSERELIGGAHDLVADALRMYGFDRPDVVAVICETIERHAVRTLFDRRPAPLPDTFALYVTGLVVKEQFGESVNGSKEARSPAGVG